MPLRSTEGAVAERIGALPPAVQKLPWLRLGGSRISAPGVTSQDVVYVA